MPETNQPAGGTMRITTREYDERCERLIERLRAEGWRGAVLFDRDYILYYTGFAFIPTERPIALVLNTAGERVLLVPRLEREHAEAYAHVHNVETYPEYPDTVHPMVFLANIIDALGITGALAADHDGYPWILGYRGPSLTELTGGHPANVRPLVEAQMMIKSPAEVALIRESVKWANLAHTLLQRYTRVGATETEVSQRASDEATRAMLDAIGPIYRAQSAFGHGAHAGYRGQIGRQSAIPHALANNLTFQAGDVLVTGASAPVWGYLSELERTLIVGTPSDEQKRFFDTMCTLQEIALQTMRPGITCADVDRTVRAAYEQLGIADTWRHHTGHAIGLRYHEGPFLDVGDNTVLQPGMVFTVEPGVYVPGLGGFRHSDTVLITEDGIEVLTYYPRELDALTIPA